MDDNSSFQTPPNPNESAGPGNQHWASPNTGGSPADPGSYPPPYPSAPPSQPFAPNAPYYSRPSTPLNNPPYYPPPTQYPTNPGQYAGPPSTPYGNFAPPSTPLGAPYTGYPYPPGNSGYPPINNYAYPSVPLTAPTPAKRRLTWWQWGLIGVGSVFLACCVCSMMLGLLSSNGSASTSSGRGNSAYTATDTPEPTATPKPTATATPVPVGVGDHMALGTDYAQNSDGFYITHPQDTFTDSDQFAFVVALDRPFGTTSVDILLVRIQSGGAESVVYSVSQPISDPNYNMLANRVSTQTVMVGSPPGRYKLEISNGSSILAKATFTYKG